MNQSTFCQPHSNQKATRAFGVLEKSTMKKIRLTGSDSKSFVFSSDFQLSTILPVNRDFMPDMHALIFIYVRSNV